MRIRKVRWSGDFESVEVPGDPEHRTLGAWIVVWWEVRVGGEWRLRSLTLRPGRRWDGASRPEWVGWLVPRFGVLALASLVHDELYKRRGVTRKEADLLFLKVARACARARLQDWKVWPQLALAELEYRAVWAFGEPTWDKHDEEFRK